MSELPAFVDLASLAEVLDDLGREIERLGEILCGDPAMAATHMNELQAIDLIAQKQHALSSLLRAECPKSALAALGLEDLRQRIEAPRQPY